VLLAGAGAGAFGCSKRGRVEARVHTAKDWARRRDADGHGNGHASSRCWNVEVGSQISGIILTLSVDFNSEVKSNQVIAQLDPATYRANVSSAEGDLANAQASLEAGADQRQARVDLFNDKLVAQSDYDQSIATLIKPRRR